MFGFPGDYILLVALPLWFLLGLIIRFIYRADTNDDRAAGRKQHSNHIRRKSSCFASNQIPENRDRSPRIIEAFNGDRVLVIPEISLGNFKFYRDKDGDGYPETKGRGFYLGGLSRVTRENEISEIEEGKSLDQIKKTRTV